MELFIVHQRIRVQTWVRRHLQSLNVFALEGGSVLAGCQFAAVIHGGRRPSVFAPVDHSELPVQPHMCVFRSRGRSRTGPGRTRSDNRRTNFTQKGPRSESNPQPSCSESTALDPMLYIFKLCLQFVFFFNLCSNIRF